MQVLILQSVTTKRDIIELLFNRLKLKYFNASSKARALVIKIINRRLTYKFLQYFFVFLIKHSEKLDAE